MVNNIRIIRLSKGLTQAQLAERLKNDTQVSRKGTAVSRRWIGILENKTSLSEDTCRRIAKALHVKTELITKDGLSLSLQGV